MPGAARAPHWSVAWALALLLLIAAPQRARATPALPRLELAQEFVLLAPGQETAQVTVRLVGAAGEAGVRARLADGAAESALVAAAVEWPPGEEGDRVAALRVPDAVRAGAERAFAVRLFAEGSGAELAPGGAAALLSLDDLSALPRFEFEPAGSAFPGDEPEVTVRLAAGSPPLAAPAALLWRLVPRGAAPGAPRFLPAAAAAGVLRFEPGERARTLPVRVAWAAVPPEAQYRLGLELAGLENAWPVVQADDTAVHLFGVRPGTCPPGTSVRGAAPAAAAAARAGGWYVDAGAPGERAARSAAADAAETAGRLALLVDGEPVVLTARAAGLHANGSAPAFLDFGASVPPGAASATLCVRAAEGGGAPRVVAAAPTGVRPAPARAEACRCKPSAAASCPKDGGGASAWTLPLAPGAAAFNVSEAGGGGARYAVSVVRLAPRAHAELLQLTVRGLDGSSFVLCGPPPPQLASGAGAAGAVMAQRSTATAAEPGAPPAGSAAGEGGVARAARLAAAAPAAWAPCEPGAAMALELPPDFDTAALAPVLRHPEVEGVRVEVNGQVLSRAGDAAADRRADTARAGPAAAPRVPGAFLPAAYVLGMQPGVPVAVNVVVVAEDGATSARYPVELRRAGGGAGGGVSYAAEGGVGGGGAVRLPGWPLAPADDARCEVCPAGWAAPAADAAACGMCPPGSSAPAPGAPRCELCAPGSYAAPWGATHCAHCIAGTAAPAAGAALCALCSEGATTAGDGAAACNVTLPPATDLARRYAVVVHVSLFVKGVDLEGLLALRAGVDAPPEAVVGGLLRGDVAAGFGVPLGDVRVVSLARVARRTLRAELSATLPADLPPGGAAASEEEVAAALALQRISADVPIGALSSDPGAFFGRTAAALGADVQPLGAVAVDSWPQRGPRVPPAALAVPGAFAVLGGAALAVLGTRRGWRPRGGCCWSARRYERQP